MLSQRVGQRSSKKKLSPKQQKALDEHRAVVQASKDYWSKQPTFASRGPPTKVVLKEKGVPELTTPPGRTTTQAIKSYSTPGGHATKPVSKVYTGTAMLGVATMHKSNSVPVFEEQHLVDISNMRRNDYTR